VAAFVRTIEFKNMRISASFLSNLAEPKHLISHILRFCYGIRRGKTVDLQKSAIPSTLQKSTDFFKVEEKTVDFCEVDENRGFLQSRGKNRGFFAKSRKNRGFLQSRGKIVGFCKVEEKPWVFAKSRKNRGFLQSR